MKKILSIFAFSLIFAASVFAGDAAVFDEIGFSQDGSIFIFGEYGKLDKTYKGFAEIYVVDVAKNDFVPGEVYKKNCDEKDESSGKKAYEELKKSTEWKLAKYRAKPSKAKNLLYVRESENKNPTAEIKFKSYEESTETRDVFYKINLVPEISGTGRNVRSKFYISIKKETGDGTVLGTWKAGTPDLWRKGISSYLIDKIFTDESGTSLVFVVQKTLEDDKGTSIRYMVETLKMQP